MQYFLLLFAFLPLLHSYVLVKRKSQLDLIAVDRPQPPLSQVETVLDNPAVVVKVNHCM
jgi:hypothetical protein